MRASVGAGKARARSQPSGAALGHTPELPTGIVDLLSISWSSPFVPCRQWAWKHSCRVTVAFCVPLSVEYGEFMSERQGAQDDCAYLPVAPPVPRRAGAALLDLPRFLLALRRRV